MRFFRNAGGRVVAVALFLACALDFGLGLASAFRVREAAQATPVQAAAIELGEAGHENGICHHHLQGCPKDCFCPKIEPGKETGSAAAQSGSLREPALVECTESGPSHSAPAFSVFMPDNLWEWLQALEAVGLLKPVENGLFPNPFLDPPTKVPIA